MADYRKNLTEMDKAIRSVSALGPKIAITHPLAVPGTAIARERGSITAIVAAYLAPSNLRTCHDPLRIGPWLVPRWLPTSWRPSLWRLIDKIWVDPVALPHLNAVRRSLDLPETYSFINHTAQTPDLSVTLFPAWFAAPQPDWPKPLITGEFPLFEANAQGRLREDLLAFLLAGEKPLVFTPGTSNLHAADFFTHALAAVNRLGRRAIFLTRERAQIPDQLPEFVQWQPYVPLAELLPHTAALVHHGGIGTTAESLRAGIPQLILPFAWDQFDNGERVAALGVGTVIAAQRLRPGKLAHSLQALVSSDSIRGRCAQVAARFSSRQDPAALFREIERLMLAQQHEDQPVNISGFSGELPSQS
jgi:rhamnosyltransferase subunit B